MMKKHPFYTSLIFPLVIFCSAQLGVESQSTPCTTPTNHQGQCVPIQRCPNVYRFTVSSRPVPQALTDYINQVACTLPGVERSVCCEPNQVIKEEAPITQKSDLLPSKHCGRTTNNRLAYYYIPQVFDFPWMAVLQYDDGNGTLVDGCGGSLINKRYVLTAASCIQKKSPLGLVNVRLGEHTKNQDEDCNILLDSDGEELERDCANPPEDFKIESVVVHPDFDRTKFTNDVGLIRLNKDVTLQEHIIPTCLPVTPELRTKQFEWFKISGWGVTENSTGSQVMMKAGLSNVNNTECQQMMNQNRINVQLSDKQMCAAGRDQMGSCQSDTGGPLGRFTDYNHRYHRFVQYGVASAGVDSCGLKTVPGIYTRVTSYVDWILENIEA